MNFDGIPGPTHNYSGLAQGNLAAERNAQQIANPREAALQGLAKMRALAARGIAQGVLPPQERPDVAALRALGFHGRDADLVARAAATGAGLLAACSSAAAMWVAMRRRSAPPPTAPTAACISRRRTWSRISTARWRRRRPRACCARSSPTRRASASTIRSRRRRSSATKARPITPASARRSTGPAPSSSSTDAAASAPDRCRHATLRGKRARRARRSPAPRPRPRPRRVREQRPDTIDAGVFHTRCHRRRRRRPPPLPRTGVRRSARAAADAVARRGRLSVRSSCSNAELPLADAVATYLFDQPADRALRRPLPAGRAERSAAPASSGSVRSSSA